MTLRELLRTVWFGRWLVVGAIVAALAGAAFYLSGQPASYVAEATVQIVASDRLSSAGVQIDSDPTLVSGTAVSTAAAVAIGNRGLAQEIEDSVTGAYVSSSVDRVTVSAQNRDAAMAVKVANAVATAYVAQLKSQFDLSVTSMQSRLDALGTSIQQNAAAIQSGRAIPGSSTTTDLLQAQYTASMNQYQGLLTQIADARVISSPASIRQNASSARLASISALVGFAVAALGGLVIGVGLAVARRGLDTKVRATGAARRAAGAPILVRLQGTAQARRGYEASGELPVAIRTATSFTQSVRELRTSLQAAVEASSGAVIVVTSADREAPRSFLAANLAASFALSGRRVVALSGDLRQPRLNDMLPAASARSQRSLSEQSWDAEGSSGLVGALQATDIPNLRVYPALLTELDPADYLASDEVRDLVADLRKSADVVIVDAPPILVAADAAILGTYADGVLVAATVGETELVAVEESVSRLRSANARLLGLVLDGMADRRRGEYATTYTFTGHAAGATAGGSARPASNEAESSGGRVLQGSA